jgi:hypothetical protein
MIECISAGVAVAPSHSSIKSLAIVANADNCDDSKNTMGSERKKDISLASKTSATISLSCFFADADTVDFTDFEPFTVLLQTGDGKQTTGRYFSAIDIPFVSRPNKIGVEATRELNFDFADTR